MGTERIILPDKKCEREHVRSIVVLGTNYKSYFP